MPFEVAAGAPGCAAALLAAHLREYSGRCAPDAPATRAMLEVAAQLEATAGSDLARLSAAYDTAEARAAAAVDPDWRHAWEGVAYGCARVADGVAAQNAAGG